jgi:hypothetical protein
MDNPIHKIAEMKELKRDSFMGSTEDAERNGKTNISMKEPDTMLSMTVLLLACLALAALAHAFIS